MHCGYIKYKSKNNSKAECTNYPGEAEPPYDTVLRKVLENKKQRLDTVTFNSQMSSF